MILTTEERERTAEEFPPLSENSVAILNRRYLMKDEDGVVCEGPDDMFWRVAWNLAEADARWDATPEEIEAVAWEFYRVMRALEFLPNSPTLMNAGRDLQQLSACFVLPVEDSLDDIFTQVKETAMIHKSGGGTGFSFSHLRPSGDRVRSTSGVASGPASFIRIFDVATDVVKQGGTRRGANMGVLSVRHPDIMAFIKVKSDGVTLQNFNISVGVDNDFMSRVEQKLPYELVNPRNGEVTGTLPAHEVWAAIVDGAWSTGDPGVLFMDRINEDNPNPQLAKVEATNPCGEATLLPYESCNLGSVNLGRMVSYDEHGDAYFDEERLRRVVFTAVHMLDNVIEQNEFPVQLIAERTRATRRIGVGVMGFADLLILLGIRYDSWEGTAMAETVMGKLNELVVEASRDLATRRQPFPEFHNSLYASNGEPPRRNSAPTTIAPTGTISRIAGASSGIEPLFALNYTSEIMDGTKMRETYRPFVDFVDEHGCNSPALDAQLAEAGFLLPTMDVPQEAFDIFRVSHQIDPLWHVRMQAAFQRHCESAVSKTVNLPSTATREQISDVYFQAFHAGCKGVTVYRDRSKDHQVLSLGTQGEVPATNGNGNGSVPHGGGLADAMYQVLEVKHPNGHQNGNHQNGNHQAEPFTYGPHARSPVFYGSTRKLETGHGRGYITINMNEQGRMVEVFANIGKAGRCDDVTMEALTRMVSLYLRIGGDPREVVQQLSDHVCCPAYDPDHPGRQIKSMPDAVAVAIMDALNDPNPIAVQGGELSVQPALMNGHETLFPGRSACRICGGDLVQQEGCATCYSCGWNSCS